MELQLDIDINTLTEFLNEKNILNEGEKVLSIEKPGEGNMNVVLRISTNQRSFIAKQSRHFVQKYQDIPAPIDRIAVEHRFYQTIEGSSINSYFPGLIGFYPEDHMMILEDLGESLDMTFAYEQRNVSEAHIQQLVSIARGIHQNPIKEDYPSNLELRKLNHQHVFVLPFLEENGFSLDSIQEGLQNLSLSIKTNQSLKGKVKKLGELYLSTGDVLLHGDYYPGSWIIKDDQVFVLDPEFSHVGMAEFDLGVMIAHIFMSTGMANTLDQIIKDYVGSVDTKLVREFAGTEVIRRLIGLAQLPLERSLEEKKQLLDVAKAWLVD